MILILAFLFVFVFSVAPLRRGRQESLSSLRSPAARVFFQPSQTQDRREFLNGKVTLLKIKEEGTLMLVKDRTEISSSPAFLLKSQEPHRFETTLMTVTGSGGLRVHANLRDREKVVVFRA